jgi:hypothetical protein
LRSNSLRRPIDTVDDRLLSWIENNVLTENVVLETLAIVRRRLRRANRQREHGAARPRSAGG